MFKSTLLMSMLLSSTALASVAVNPTGDTTGTRDTLAISNICKAGHVPHLNASPTPFYVTEVNSCRKIEGDGGIPVYFWYEGQRDLVQVQGVGSSRGVITCATGSSCLFTDFTVIPGVGQAGFVMDGVHGMALRDVNVIDINAQGKDCIDAQALSGSYNQLLKVFGGVFIHCGGWGLNTSTGAGFNDSFIIGTNFSNNQAGNINRGAGYGTIWGLNKIEDTYGSNGIVFSAPNNTSGDDVLVGNIFDQENIDMQFLTNWYGVISTNISCTTPSAYGNMFSIEGSPYIAGGINTACGPTYHELPGLTPFLDFADPNPMYTDPTSQQLVSPSVHN